MSTSKWSTSYVFKDVTVAHYIDPNVTGALNDSPVVGGLSTGGFNVLPAYTGTSQGPCLIESPDFPSPTPLSLVVFAVDAKGTTSVGSSDCTVYVLDQEGSPNARWLYFGSVSAGPAAASLAVPKSAKLYVQLTTAGNHLESLRVGFSQFQ